MSLEIGQKAPDFNLPSSEGGNLKLSSLKGKPVVLYFYPKDDTPGCTKESCDFRDNMGVLKRHGVVVLGLSKDSLKKHEKFIEKYDLNFPLLSDEEGKTIEAYGAWVEKSMYGKKYMGIQRSTYLIDDEGNLAYLWRDVKVDGHAVDVIDQVKKLIASKAA